jgi:hypothetical protein
MRFAMGPDVRLGSCHVTAHSLDVPEQTVKIDQQRRSWDLLNWKPDQVLGIHT